MRPIIPISIIPVSIFAILMFSVTFARPGSVVFR